MAPPPRSCACPGCTTSSECWVDDNAKSAARVMRGLVRAIEDCPRLCGAARYCNAMRAGGEPVALCPRCAQVEIQLEWFTRARERAADAQAQAREQ